MSKLWIVPVVVGLGALWRRWFGGYPKGGKRWMKLLSLAALLLPSLWVVSSWYVTLPIALLIGSWLPGHKWSEGYLRLLRRYAPWHGAIAVLLMFIVGPIAGLVYMPVVGLIPLYYWWAHERAITLPFQSTMIDGSIALAELSSGGTSVGIFYLAILL